jgi:DNA invertase Pin-like site-specific DNA recombinase
VVKAAIYVRLSDEDRDKKHLTDESESIVNQKAMLCDYCKERNWDVYDIYCDEDYSGADRNRPGFNRMIDDCKNKRINIVLCKSQSRFSRDMEVIEKYIHNKFVEWDVRFVSIIDRADSYDLANKKARQINGLINEWYLEDASENIRKTLQSKKQRGEFTGSFAPFGYVKDPENKNHLIIDEYAAPIVRDIFDRYLQGWGYRKIVIKLNELGIPNPTLYKQQQNSTYVNLCYERSASKGLWTNSSVYRLIRNENYTGTLVQGKTQTVSYKNSKRKHLPKDDWIKVPNCHEPIISQATWDRTVEKINGKTRASTVTQELWSLSGKIRCAVCNAPMKRTAYYMDRKKTRKGFYLVCGTYRNGALNCTNTSTVHGFQFEALMVAQINEWIENFCVRDKIQIQSEHEAKLNRLNADIAMINPEIVKADRIITELYKDKYSGNIPQERFNILNAECETELAKLKKRLKSLEDQKESVLLVGFDEERRKQLIEKYTFIDKLTRPIADEFIEIVYIGQKIEGHEREISVHWKF